jgi:uncharacterized protein (TIGR03118 family)
MGRGPPILVSLKRRAVLRRRFAPMGRKDAMHRIKRRRVSAVVVLAPAVWCLLAASALSSERTSPVPSGSTFRAIPGARPRNQYTVTPLVSDGFLPAPHLDPLLVNAWGLARGPAGPWWVADNGADMATLYAGDGVANSLVVSLPAGTAPTGLVFNIGESFVVSDGANSGPALFIFASEDGRILGWHPAVPPPTPSPDAFPVRDDSAAGAIYKGLAIATTANGDRLCLTDFRNRRIEVLDGAFHPVDMPEDAFVDARIPDAFGPFGIQNIQGLILVTYARRDAGGEEDVPGRGQGFINAFTTDGLLVARVATGGPALHLHRGPPGARLRQQPGSRIVGRPLLHRRPG